MGIALRQCEYEYEINSKALGMKVVVGLSTSKQGKAWFVGTELRQIISDPKLVFHWCASKDAGDRFSESEFIGLSADKVAALIDEIEDRVNPIDDETMYEAHYA